MRALTLTQPWAGLVASGIILRGRFSTSLIKREDFGEPFAIHASRETDQAAHDRILEIRRDLYVDSSFNRDWRALARIHSAVIAIATIDAVVEGPPRGTAGFIDESQRRWYFGPIGYVLRDVIALPEPVPCRGWQGFWTLPAAVATSVEEQLR